MLFLWANHHWCLNGFHSLLNLTIQKKLIICFFLIWKKKNLFFWPLLTHAQPWTIGHFRVTEGQTPSQPQIPFWWCCRQSLFPPLHSHHCPGLEQPPISSTIPVGAPYTYLIFIVILWSLWLFLIRNWRSEKLNLKKTPNGYIVDKY